MDFPIVLRELGPVLHTMSPEALLAAGRVQGQTLAGAASSTWNVANQAEFVAIHIHHPITITKLFCLNGAVVSGNVDVGIYGPDGRRIASAGSTAQAGTNALQTFDITDVVIGPGDFYLACALDNTTGTIFRTSTFSSSRLGQTVGRLIQTSAFPLPASATYAAWASTQGIRIFGALLAPRTVL